MIVWHARTTKTKDQKMASLQGVWDALIDEMGLLVRHGRQIPQRHLVRCVQVWKLLDDPELEIALDAIVQTHCDEGTVLPSTNTLWSAIHN